MQEILCEEVKKNKILPHQFIFLIYKYERTSFIGFIKYFFEI
jgi:hypothetical protein